MVGIPKEFYGNFEGYRRMSAWGVSQNCGLQRCFGEEIQWMQDILHLHHLGSPEKYCSSLSIMVDKVLRDFLNPKPSSPNPTDIYIYMCAIYPFKSL